MTILLYIKSYDSFNYFYCFEFRGNLNMDALVIKDNFKFFADNPSHLIYGSVINDADFTLCIPIYGCGPSFEKCLESVKKQLDTDLKIQIIISDNKKYDSNNEALELIKKMELPNLAYYLTDQEMTQFGNFNRCIELSQTKYFGMLHDDDLLVLNYFRVVKAILPRLMEKNNIGVVQAKYKYIFDDVLEEKTGKIMIRSISKRNITILGLSGIGAPTCGTIFNKDALLKCGGFNHDFTSSGDMILGGVLINNGYKLHLFMNNIGYYRLGQNYSIKLSACQGFVKDNCAFRESWCSKKRLRMLYLKVFGNFLYSKNIDSLVESVGRFNKEVTINSLDFRHTYKHYTSYNLLTVLFIVFRIINKILNLTSIKCLIKEIN